jgi:hypothetical protein
MRCLTLISIALVAHLHSPTVLASDLVAQQTVQNTDWTQTGLGGMRGVGTGTITLTGVIGTVTRAYLYWHGPTNLASADANASVSFAGSQIFGTNIGFSDDNFWDSENSQAYRADVTSLVTGNGAYSLSDFDKTGVEVNGASLIVFFDDGNPSNNRDVVLLNGNDANFGNPFDAFGWNSTLSGINYSGGAAYMSFHVSDGQNFSSSDDGDLRINGVIISTGGIFQGDTTPFSSGGVANGKLWDIRTFDVTSFLAGGATSLTLQLSPVFDALSLVAVAVELPMGSAPVVPEPPAQLLLLAGLASMLFLRRYTKRLGATSAPKGILSS